MTNRHSTNSVETLESIWKPGPNSQFFRAQNEWEADRKARVYGHQFRRAWDADEGLGLWAVLCVDGKPAVYFKRVDRKQPEQENEWQRRLWNQGTATMLVVQDAQEVRVYSGLARPEKHPASSDDDLRLIDVFDYAASALELANFIRSVETGQFYRDYPDKFSSERAIDRYLLDNLGEARDQLCDPESEFRLPPSTAHAFLGRCLFTSYLLERGIIGPSQLRRAGARGSAVHAKTLTDLLDPLGATDATNLLYGLFRVLKDDFNGSMFGGRLAGEKPQIRKRHIDVLVRFLRGDEMKTQRSLLFPLYDFRFIPIEFISAVYEDFLAAEDETSEKLDLANNSKRRKAGAYYTPPRLAELVVDIATEGWDTLLNKRCLDPACGSGIFLVILFQRMAEEWRRRNPRATNTKRARALRAMLANSLCGVDVNETACMVACFSLYLAFMDQFDDPRDIWELANELKKTGTEKVLPLLMASSDDDEDEQPASPAIHVANFFGPELPELSDFDLTLGNPPWVGRNQPADHVLEQWILNEPKQGTPGNPFIKELSTCPKDKMGRRSWFLPNRQSANAFMWKAPLHVKRSGTICLLLPAKVLLANQIDDFQSAWFRRFSVDVIWQLADYSFILFVGADCPAVIIRYHPDKQSGEDQEIAYITPKVTSLDPRDADIPILSDDQKVIRLSEVFDAADRRRAFTVWKKHFWGTIRDQELIDRLMRFPPLSRLAGEPEEGKRFTKGQGFKPFDAKKYAANPKRYGEPRPRWWADDDLFLDARTKGWNWFLLKGDYGDCRRIGNEWTQLHRGFSQEVFRAPAVILNQGFTKFAFTDFPVLFRHSLQAISGRRGDDEILLFLTAVLNSPLATYFLFHTSANWGIERDKVHFEEVLTLPFPLPEDTPNEERNQEILKQVAEMLGAAKSKAERPGFTQIVRDSSVEGIRDELFQLVYEYYSLCAWERVLVEDTVRVFEPSSTPTLRRRNTETQRITNEGDHCAYADLLCGTLNGWLQRQPWKLSASVAVARKSGLGLLTVTRTRQPEDFIEQPAGNDFEKVLLRIQKAIGHQHGGIAYARGFAFFEPEQFHILKPLALRQWTKTAALNDADQLMGFMAAMEARSDVNVRG